MPQFQTVEEAFEWFLENVFPTLSTEEKLKLKDAKYGFYKEGIRISHKRMVRIMNDYGKFGILYTYEIED